LIKTISIFKKESGPKNSSSRCKSTCKSAKNKRWGICYTATPWFRFGKMHRYFWYETEKARDEAMGKTKYKFYHDPVKVER